MTKYLIAGGLLAMGLLLVAIAVVYRIFEPVPLPGPMNPSEVSSVTSATTQTHPASANGQGFLYGRITTVEGTAYKGRLRWGGNEEASWGDYFNGSKDVNPWAIHVPPEQLKERRPVKIFGAEIGSREHKINLDRPFMSRFGDITQIEASAAEIRVTLKSGTLFILNRNDADDLADGVRIWDETHGVLDLREGRIHTIELLPSDSGDPAPYRLHGTVRTRQGEFTGFLQWDRQDGVGHDLLEGHTAEGAVGVPYETIRSISRSSQDSALVTLLDGREMLLSDSREVGQETRGIYVNDQRYGRVLISWDAFERVDFSSAGSGPAYGTYPPGQPLTGSVTTRGGDLFAGRLVFDLDESETHETLDAPSHDVVYTIPFGLIASIVPPGGRNGNAPGNTVTLHDGEQLQLEPTGDLSDANGGMLIFIDGRERAEYVRWADVEQVNFERQASTFSNVRISSSMSSSEATVEAISARSCLE